MTSAQNTKDNGCACAIGSVTQLVRINFTLFMFQDAVIERIKAIQLLLNQGHHWKFLDRAFIVAFGRNITVSVHRAIFGAIICPCSCLESVFEATETR